MCEREYNRREGYKICPRTVVDDWQPANERGKTLKTFLIAAAMVSVVSSVNTSAQTNGAGQSDQKKTLLETTHLAAEIFSLEQRRIDAMVKKDIPTLDTLLADDLSYTHSGGTTDTKSSFLALIKERGRYLGIDYSDTQIIPWGGNAVVVRGIALIRLENTPAYSVLFMDVWALRDGGWKMVAWQATRIPKN
jgi:hypothetical protein